MSAPGCPGKGNQQCKGELCGHCKKCGDYLDNHGRLGLTPATRHATRCPTSKTEAEK